MKLCCVSCCLSTNFARKAQAFVHYNNVIGSFVKREQGGAGCRLHATRSWPIKRQRLSGLVENAPVLDNDGDFLAGW